MLTKSYEIISGIHTDIISHYSKSELQILIFPGNPGITDFYRNFAEEIIRSLGDCSIYIIGYAGFSEKKPERHYTLQDELEHKISVIDHLRKKWPPNSRTVILGHSIGSWIGMEIVKKFTNELNITLFLLFPFIARSDNEIQENFSKMAGRKRYFQFLLTGYKIFQKLPQSLTVSILKFLYSHASEDALKIIQKFFLEKNHIPENIRYLANSEFHTLPYELEMDFFQSRKNSVILFYCHKDIWAPVSQLELIRTQIPEIKGEILPLMTHDFCVNTDQCRILAERIGNFFP